MSEKGVLSPISPEHVCRTEHVDVLDVDVSESCLSGACLEQRVIESEYRLTGELKRNSMRNHRPLYSLILILLID